MILRHALSHICASALTAFRNAPPYPANSKQNGVPLGILIVGPVCHVHETDSEPFPSGLAAFLANDQSNVSGS